MLVKLYEADIPSLDLTVLPFDSPHQVFLVSEIAIELFQETPAVFMRVRTKQTSNITIENTHSMPIQAHQYLFTFLKTISCFQILEGTYIA